MTEHGDLVPSHNKRPVTFITDSEELVTAARQLCALLIIFGVVLLFLLVLTLFYEG